MTKAYRLLAALVVALVTLSFTSCESDTPNPEKEITMGYITRATTTVSLVRDASASSASQTLASRRLRSYLCHRSSIVAFRTLG